MSTHGINAIGVLVGNPDEIVFVLTKGDVERVYNMQNNRNLGTLLPESVWSAFTENMERLDDMLDHAAAIECILAEHCRIPTPPIEPPPTSAPSSPPPTSAPSPPPPTSAPSPPPPTSAPSPHPPAEPHSVPAADNWDKLRRKKYDTKKFTPPGYGRHVVWSAHRVRAFMLALSLKPTVYDTNLRTLAKIAGVHPYDFRWNTNPISFGAKRGLSDLKMRQMMGNSFEEMRQRFSVKAW